MVSHPPRPHARAFRVFVRIAALYLVASPASLSANLGTYQIHGRIFNVTLLSTNINNILVIQITTHCIVTIWQSVYCTVTISKIAFLWYVCLPYIVILPYYLPHWLSLATYYFRECTSGSDLDPLYWSLQIFHKCLKQKQLLSSRTPAQRRSYSSRLLLGSNNQHKAQHCL